MQQQHSTPDRRTPSATEQRPSAPNPARTPMRRAIDCGGSSSDDQAGRARPQERGDARHGYLSSRGIYADQSQAI